MHKCGIRLFISCKVFLCPAVPSSNLSISGIIKHYIALNLGGSSMQLFSFKETADVELWPGCCFCLWVHAASLL